MTSERPLLMQKLSPVTDLASKPLESFISEPVMVGTEDPISDVVGKMFAKKLYEVFVPFDKGFGVVTLRAILRGGELSGRKLSTVAVRSPVTNRSDPVFKAAIIMSGLRVRSLPITDSTGKLEGAASSATILQELAKTGSSQAAVSEIMSTGPTTIDFSDNLDKARSIMVDRDFDHLPVTRDGKLVGLITSLDLAQIIGPTDRTNRTSKVPEPSSRGSVKVGGIMTNELVTCEPTDDSLQVLRKILERRRTAAVVVDGGLVRGIVTLRDYVKLLAVQPEPTGQPVYVVGLPEHDFESSVAESKFRRSIEALSQVYQGIIEARATVKTTSLEKDRRRFEVHVLIRLPREQFDFTEEGWSVADVFEKIGAKIKRLMTKPRDIPSRRRYPARGETATERY